ncbi:Uncharacterised protein [Bordetella pertussis]|nr:Uncharacterised protein [Bordetella pertussis]CFO64731.1 Uncharacterised protein [Bordetella pertussis]CFU79267.1 Uncharacterised protein [Bordetella pertussis]CPH68709.1 Uncharacterised protein [Bordetella pertussis]CPK46351.1 Uncharacterised protein [Bordetella pertussis]
MPLKPSRYIGVKVRKKPTNQHQNEYLPRRSFSLKPKALGNQYTMPAMHPNTTPPMMVLWKCATRNRLLCSTNDTAGMAISTPVMPPMTKMIMKPMVHSMGSENSTRPRYMVNSQLNTFAPVGMEMIMVMMPKNALTLAPAPMVKKWCSQTRNESTPIEAVA